MLRRILFAALALVMLVPPVGAGAAPLCPGPKAMDMPMACCAMPSQPGAAVSAGCCCCPQDAPCHVNSEPPVYSQSLFIGPVVSVQAPQDQTGELMADQSAGRSPASAAFMQPPSPVPLYLRLASMLI